MTKSALKRAIEVCGGPAALARALNIKPPSVIGWGDLAPIDRCPAIEFATAGAVTVEELRPEVEWQRTDGQITGYVVPLLAKAG